MMHGQTNIKLRMSVLLHLWAFMEWKIFFFFNSDFSFLRIFRLHGELLKISKPAQNVLFKKKQDRLAFGPFLVLILWTDECLKLFLIIIIDVAKKKKAH